MYAAGIRNGRPLSYLLDDTPLTVDLAPGTWTPRNFDGSFVGRIPMRRALYQSRNVPTIRLGIELGTQTVIDEARRFGITTPIPGYPSIFIGAADVYPIEMVSAYTAFANLGTRAAPLAITRVEDSQGNTLWSPEPSRYPVMSQEEAWLMVSAMKDVVRQGTAAGTVGANFRYPAGGKTGTTNDGTDVWFIGYTSDLVAGVWMGFDKPQKIKANAQGGILAAPAWVSFMNEVYRRRPAPRDWPTPPNIITRDIDASTNMIATPYCPRGVVTTESFVVGTDPIGQCNVHIAPVLNPDTTGAAGANPPGTYPPGTYPPAYPPGTSPPSSVVTPPSRVPIDTTRTTVMPGATPPIRPPRPQPADTSVDFATVRSLEYHRATRCTG